MDRSKALVEVRLDCPEPSQLGLPVSFGVPVEPGILFPREPTGLFLESRRLPAQIQPYLHWPDNSVRWLQVEAIVPVEGTAEMLLCRLEHAAHAPQVETRVAVEANAPWRAEMRSPFGPVDMGFVMYDIDGEVLSGAPRQGCRTEQNTLKITHWGKWEYAALGRLAVDLMISEYPEIALCCIDITLHNPNRASHPRGIWDLGDPGSVVFGGFETVLKFPAAQLTWVSLDGGETRCEVMASGFALEQASSGGVNWKSRNHVDRAGTVTTRFKGFRSTLCGYETGLRARPVLQFRSDAGQAQVAFPEFWQNFPKSLRQQDEELEVGLFPRADGTFELQGGERKTHRFWLSVASETENLGWVFSPPIARVAYEEHVRADLLPRVGEDVQPIETILHDALDGDDSVFVNRECVDEYGWRNYGEIFADHETQFYEGPAPLISHYNNQFDQVLGFLLHYLRTGDRRLFSLGDALARHVTDIDIYWTTEDRPEYNGGLFWFTDHYLHAHTSTHRAYSRHNQDEGQDYGGGPGPEHNFTSGLLLHHLLTGAPGSREAVISLANWVIAMDGDGILGPRGTATMTASPTYHGPGRGAGLSLNALLDGWTMTGDSRYLAFAERILRRVIHPADDINALGLLDAEKRWSYTVFLTSLVKYLRVKRNAGQVDDRYGFARASLLHYARWMEVNERPYLDRPEALEFPTEAWAAQELRKANVLLLAAAYGSEEEAERFVAKGDRLRGRAWSDLLGFETRAHARSLAIVMYEGIVGSGAAAAGQSEPRGPDGLTFGRPRRFRPWPILAKQLAKRLLRR